MSVAESVAGSVAESVARSVAQTSVDSVSLPLDSYSPAAAYSFSRKLRTAYSGSAFEVRRSSDNALEDIGFTSEGLVDEAALTAFVGANDGFVRTIYDQSGNAINAQQTTTSAQWRVVVSGTVQKQNTRITALAASTNYYLTSGSFTYTELSSCSVARWAAAANALYQFGATNVGGSLFYNVSTLNVRGPTGDATVNASLNTLYQVSALNKSARRMVWLNGAEGTENTTSNTFSNTNVALTLGALNSTTYRMSGFIGECVFFESEIADADRQAIESDQMSHWGIS